MLSIPTLKVLRKWRDRAFLAREWVRERIELRDRKRVLAWPPWPSFEQSLRLGFARTRHELQFGPVPPGGGDFDVVLPLTNDQIIACAEDEVLTRRNPLPLPRREIVELCDDKEALNARLTEEGFGAHVPGVPAPGEYPYFLKKRRDAGSQNIYRIDGVEDERAHAALLHAPDYFRQRCIAGEVEYAAHLLHFGGRIRQALTMRYSMPSPVAIKWRDPALLQRRCRNHPDHLRLFARMLTAIGFEGICCVNYKVQAGAPQVFEINPRIGLTLGYFFPIFLRSLDWSRSRPDARRASAKN